MERGSASTVENLSLVQPLIKYWRRNSFSQVFTKAIGVILLWNFSTGLMYSLLLYPSSTLQLEHIKVAYVLFGLSSALFWLSPFAGYLADVKLSRFNTLRYSTYIMTVSVGFILLTFIVFISTIHSIGLYFGLLIAMAVIALFIYMCGKVFFQANILQFGTDQLCDAPTQCSVLFLYAYLWCDNFRNVLILSINIPGHEIYISQSDSDISIDKVKSHCILMILSSSILFCLFILILVNKKKVWFFTDNIGENPYKLVTNVIVFAMKHKAPISRSAFTYCENEHLSRIDYGKQRYGGPYTTEQVEDVKVFLGMMKIIFSMGPAFMLEFVATISSINHRNHQDFRAKNPLKLMLLDYGILSPIFTLVSIPVYVFLLKPFLSRYVPNMFKMIGFSIAILTVSIIIYFLYDMVSYGTSDELNTAYDHCKRNTNTSYVLNKSLVHIPTTYMFILQHILLSISQMLLYISAWNFICCQSPQHMKGLLFGLFFAIRDLFHFLGIVQILPFWYAWKSELARCQFGYYLLNIFIGLASLILYTIVARKYQDRKRDDICNVYQYAEDYYTKYGSNGVRPMNFVQNS